MSDNLPPPPEPTLIDIIAHDLKTPIGVVKGYLQVIEKVGELSDLQKTCADKAYQALQRMEAMINDLIEYSRLEAGEPLRQELIDLRAVAQDACDLVELETQARGITVHVAIDDSAGSIMGDPGLFHHALYNLVSNAVKYNRDDGEVWITFRRQGRVLRGDVRDTGQGIAPQDKGRVFDRFFRSRRGQEREGSGLGLAITRLIIQRHGGQIWVESEPGRGSTFSFTLPITTAGELHPDYRRSYTSGGEHPDGLDDRYQDAPEIVDTDACEDEM